MDNILKYPQSTIVNRVVPKTMFYKLSAGTLNVTDTEEMKEIEVFVVNLKQPDCPTDLFTFIDINMPHHIVFVLVHDNSAMLLINYKDWTDDTHTKFRIRQAFASPWMPMADLELTVQGQSLPRIYDNFVAQVSGIGEHKAGSLEDIVALRKLIAIIEAELKTLEKRMRKEPQLDRQLAMNKQVRQKRKQLAEIKQKMEELSV